MSVGDRIRNARINKGINQKELANMLTKKGISIGNTTISNWEKEHLSQILILLLFYVKY